MGPCTQLSPCVFSSPHACLIQLTVGAGLSLLHFLSSALLQGKWTELPSREHSGKSPCSSAPLATGVVEKLLWYFHGDWLGAFSLSLTSSDKPWSLSRPLQCCLHVFRVTYSASIWRKASVLPPSPELHILGMSSVGRMCPELLFAPCGEPRAPSLHPRSVWGTNPALRGPLSQPFLGDPGGAPVEQGVASAPPLSLTPSRRSVSATNSSRRWTSALSVRRVSVASIAFIAAAPAAPSPPSASVLVPCLTPTRAPERGARRLSGNVPWVIAGCSTCLKDWGWWGLLFCLVLLFFVSLGSSLIICG